MSALLSRALFSMALLLALLLPLSAWSQPHAAMDPVPEASVQRLAPLDIDTSGLERLRSEHLEIWYPPQAQKAAVNLATQGAAQRQRIWQNLGLEEARPIRVFLLEDLNDYFRRQKQAPRAPHWAVGLALSKDDAVLLKWGRVATGQWVNLEETLAHELAHIGLDRATQDQGEHMDGQQRVTGKPRKVPRWLHEGFAISQAHEWDLERETSLLEASLLGNLMPLQQLHSGFPADGPKVELAYAEGFHFVRYLHENWGERAFAQLMKNLQQGDSFDEAFQQTYGRRFAQVEQSWRHDLDVAYTWVPLLTGSSVFWVIGGGLFLLAWRRKRAQAQDRLEAMAREEAQEQRPRLPLPGLGLTVEDTLPRPTLPPRPPLPAQLPWNEASVLIHNPYHTYKRDPDTPCNEEGHTLH